METEKKFNLILGLCIANAVMSLTIAGSQILQRQATLSRFGDIQLFNQSVLQYRQTAEQLEKERWDNLLRRVDDLDKKLFEHQVGKTDKP